MTLAAYDTQALAATSISRYYKFEDAGPTTLADSSGNGQDATVLGSPTFGGAGVGVTWSGSNQYATIPTTGLPSGNSAYTLEVIGNLATNTTKYDVLSFGSSGTKKTNGLEFESGGDVSNWWSGANVTSAGAGIVASTDYLVTAVYDGSSTVTLYLNGTQIASGAMSAHNVTFGSANIARNVTNSGNYFAGTTKRMLITAAADSAATVLARYNAWQGTSSSPVSLTGAVGAVTLAAPAGTVSTQANVSLTGAVAPVALAAPAGTVATQRNVTLTGPVANVSAAAPAGTVATQANVTLTGPVANLATTAPAGTVTAQGSVSLAGPVAQVTIAAPAGTVSIGGNVNLTGTTAALILTAPAGTVATQRNVTLSGPVAAVAMAALAGTVATSTVVALTGPTAGIVLAAPAGAVDTAGGLSPADAEHTIAATVIPRTGTAQTIPRTGTAVVIPRTAAAAVIPRSQEAL